MYSMSRYRAFTVKRKKVNIFFSDSGYFFLAEKKNCAMWVYASKGCRISQTSDQACRVIVSNSTTDQHASRTPQILASVPPNKLLTHHCLY